ncbi:Helitron helicase domain protein [Pyrenophora teres f. maculata]|nr:Helitron helicase domain protein [Pyrenophora teres f. maculata]
MKEPDPPLDLPSENWRDDLALSDRDYTLLNNFHEQLDKEKMETCACCDEKWFHMGLNDDRVCTSCINADKELDEDMPFLYSGANDMDLGPAAAGLEPLTQIEEMLIARVHCFVEVRQINNEEVINAAPIGDDEEEEAPEIGAVPDLQAGQRELDAIQEQLESSGARRLIGRQPRRYASMSLPTLNQTPISEYQRTQARLSLAFPGLFPYGRAEYITPRPREVKFTDYVRHLMLYKDMRFAQHPRFRYVAFNTIMRHQINDKAGFFVKKLDPQNKDLSLDDLRNAFADDSDESRQMLNRITRYAANLRGTRPYWAGRMKMVEAMVRMLGCPSLFLTFSAADLHWDSLMQHMPRYEEWKAASSDVRVRIARENLRDNPHIVAFHFYRRLQVFSEEVFRDKFNMVDFWNRFEWQARGSTHNHGLWWSDGAPDAAGLDLSEEAREAFAKFWGIHVTAINPEPDSGARPATEDSTIQAPGVELENNMSTLSSTINRVQGHKCTKAYCLRKNKATGADECRFLLPDELYDEAKVDQHPTRPYKQFFPARNDSYLNKYNQLATMA